MNRETMGRDVGFKCRAKSRVLAFNRRGLVSSNSPRIADRLDRFNQAGNMVSKIGSGVDLDGLARKEWAQGFGNLVLAREIRAFNENRHDRDPPCKQGLQFDANEVVVISKAGRSPSWTDNRYTNIATLKGISKVLNEVGAERNTIDIPIYAVLTESGSQVIVYSPGN